jgi:type I site-specific restriction-modification system R (restriction) subunit
VECDGAPHGTPELPKIDAEFEEITEDEELTKKEKLKTKWPALEALVGDPKRLALIAADLVQHFEKRRAMANRFKDSKDSFRIVIVRDMWLTGFDAPCPILLL